MPDAETDRTAAQGAALEELTIPLEGELESEVLAAEAPLSCSDGILFKVVRCLWTEGGQRCYEGFRDSDGRSVWIREAWTPQAINALTLEAGILASLKVRMIPERLGFWQADDKVYLITDIRPGPNLKEAWDSGSLSFHQTLSAITQVAYAALRLHEAGWVHLSLRPEVIVPGKPASITRFDDSVRIGERPRRTFFYSGYSSPEVFKGDSAQPQADVYNVGALLFHAVTGNAIAETGPELSTFTPPKPIGGVPQILQQCLGEPETRYGTMAELHRDLLKLLKRCSPPVRYEIVSKTDIGLEPSRKTNQDACGFLTSTTEGEDGRVAWAVLGLADGMGGMDSGEVASQTAVKSFLSLAGANAHTLSDPEQRAFELKRWISVANENVCSAMARLKVRGGSTFVGLFLWQEELIAAYVGDSRLYLVRGGKAEMLTRDHSLAMGQAMQGEISLDQVRHHPDRNRVTRSLGERIPLPDYYIDTLQVCTGRPAIILEPGDLLVLCSDGLWEPVTEEEIASIAGECADLDLAVHRLTDLALARGAPDNVTVVLLRACDRQHT